MRKCQYERGRNLFGWSPRTATCGKFTCYGSDHCPIHNPHSDLRHSCHPVEFSQKKGAVYVLRSGASNFYKIGWTESFVEDRVLGLQIGNPEPLRIVEAVFADRDAEFRVHDAYQERRVRTSEWFRFDSEDEARAAVLRVVLGGRQ